MPSMPHSGAFLALCNKENWKNHALTIPIGSDDEDDDMVPSTNQSGIPPPWCWPSWQQRSGITGDIFTPSPNAHTPKMWSEPNDCAAVWAFVQAFWSLSNKDQTDFMSKKQGTDCNSVGRNLYKDWFKAQAANWRITDLVESTLASQRLSPYDQMKRLKIEQVPSFEASQAYKAYDAIGEKLFGEEAFVNGERDLLDPAIKAYVKSLVMTHWHARSKYINCNRTRMKALEVSVDDRWNAMLGQTEKGEKPDPVVFREWLKDVQTLLQYLKRHQDRPSLESLRNQRDRIKDILKSMGALKSDKVCKLPKPLRDALTFLASEDKVGYLVASLQEELENSDPKAHQAEEENHPSFNPCSEDDVVLPDINWEEGVEEFSCFPQADLWNALGISDSAVPFFNKKMDPDGQHDPWTEEGHNWFEQSENGIPLQLRWHQLVGVVKMMENAFLGKPILLMDGVGLGNTIQVAAFLALLIWFREYYQVHGKFPGKFGIKKWKSTEKNIPNHPMILIIPVNLVSQVTSEFHMYFKHGTVDILPCLGTWGKRMDWWDVHFIKCVNATGRGIILATPPAIRSDFDQVMVADNSTPTLAPKETQAFVEYGLKTFYGYSFTAVIMDEAHNCRNITQVYWAAFALCRRSEAIIAMTATPVISPPQDIWNLGRLLNVESFSTDSADEEFKLMTKALRKAVMKDRKKLQVKGAVNSMQMVRGEAVSQRGSLSLTLTVDTWMKKIRERYAGLVIRRTLKSVDYTGARISGLEPYLEHILKIQLYPHEMKNLEMLAQELIKDGGEKTAQYGSSAFYLKIGRALVHRSLNPGNPWSDPSSLQEWHKDPSRKLDVLAQIILWHQAEDGRPPLMVEGDELVPSNMKALNGDATLPDKIVVYCAFPSSYTQICQVLKLYGIPTILVHGGITPQQRSQVLTSFKNGGHGDPRVLIISSVGLTGLNIPFANIMIVVDPLWSAQDDDQLIGRVWRHPQPKVVHVYRIIADKTHDVFLNNISFSKANMLEAFTNAMPALKKLFNETDDDLDNDLDASEPEVESFGKKKGMPKMARRPRQKMVHQSKSGNLKDRANSDVPKHPGKKGQAPTDLGNNEKGIAKSITSTPQAPADLESSREASNLGLRNECIEHELGKDMPELDLEKGGGANSATSQPSAESITKASGSASATKRLPESDIEKEGRATKAPKLDSDTTAPIAELATIPQVSEDHELGKYLGDLEKGQGANSQTQCSGESSKTSDSVPASKRPPESDIEKEGGATKVPKLDATSQSVTTTLCNLLDMSESELEQALSRDNSSLALGQKIGMLLKSKNHEG